MRRALTISAWTLGGLLLLLAVLLVAVLMGGNTDSGRALIERLTAAITSGHVRLSGLSGAFPAQLQLGKLELADERGIWLRAEGISLRWHPLAMLAYRVNVDTVHAALVDMERLPVPSKSKSSHAVPSVDVAQAAVDRLELGAQLAGSPASLSVHGSYHMRSVKDATVNVVARRTDKDGDYELQLQFTAARMDAALQLREPAGGPLEHLLQLPGLGALSAQFTLNGLRGNERLALSVDAGALRARARGNLDLTHSAANLDFSLQSPAMEPHPGIGWEQLDLRGRWHGPLTTAVADGELRVEQLRIPGGLQFASIAASLAARDGKLSTHALVAGLTIPGPRPKLLQAAPLTLDASMRLDDKTYPLDVVASHPLVGLRGRVITAGEQTATLTIQLPDVAPFASLAGQDAAGNATIKAQIARKSPATELTMTANAAFTGGTATWVGVLGNRTVLQLSGTMTSEAVSLQRLWLTGRGASLTGSGTASLASAHARTTAGASTLQDLALRWQLNLTDLSMLSANLGGKLALTGTAKGPANALAVDAALSSSVSVRGAPAGAVSASLHADGLPGAPRGAVQAKGVLDGAPLQLNASLTHEADGDVRIIIRQADWKSAHAEGDLTVGKDMAQARGSLRARMQQLADLQRLLGTTLQGRIDADVSIVPHDGHPFAQLRLDGVNLATSGVAANLQLKGSGSFDALNLDLAAQVPNLGGAPATLSSHGLLNSSTRNLRLTAIDLTYRGQTASLLSPAQLSFADGLRLGGWRLGAHQAVLELDGRLSPALDLRTALHNVGPDLVNAFFPGMLAKGSLEASAEVQGSFAAPTGQVRLDAVGVRSANDAARGLPALDLHANTQLLGETALVDARLSAGSASQLTLGGRAPLNAHAAYDLKLAGKLDIGQLNPILEAHGQRASGQLNVDTSVTGTAMAPEIGGTVRLAKGNLRDYAQGVNLTDISAVLVGSHGMLRIESLSAHAATGNVSVTGTIGVMQKGVPIDMQLTAKNARPIASNIVTANLDADLHVTGNGREKLEVAGTVHIIRANIEIPGSLPPNVAVLDVRRPGQAPPPRPVKPLVIGLDVTVQAPRQILVQGRGLDAELGGELHLGGTTAEPHVRGSFDLQRGTFSLASSQLTFSTGSVAFNGSGLKNKLDPTLDFTAQSTVGDVTATLKITGLADAPKIELSSTPEMPQDEILARLLFGESASQLTALQVAQIGAALATLSGGGGGFNPLAKIQKTLGLDRLSLGGGTSSGPTNTANTGASIQAGRYVSSRVFVAVKQSTTGNSQLAVDVDLSKHLKLQTRLGNGTAITTQGTTPENDPGSSVGLAYQFEY